MANYTIELRTLIDSGIKIFDFKYPFYDENKRQEFEEKFIRHFYFREIGCETIDRFKHYLQDKMLTVFPYYNELFNSATIEYSILDNYSLKESHTLTRENSEKSHGVASNVGRLYDSQEANTETATTKATTSNNTTTGIDTETENATGTTTTNGNVDGKTTETKASSGTVNANNDNVKKFLDTPQGLTDLSDSKYLTNLTQDEGTSFQSSQDNSTTTGTNETDTTESTNSESNKNVTRNTSLNGEGNTSETASDNSKTISTGEQKSTSDNNTRVETVATQIETFEHLRKGNIGVDTDSDMIHKHIKLQKILTQIELLFFEECEDLFMMVY